MFARPGLCGMGIGRLGLVAASQPSLVAQALAILAKYGSAANLYLPGVGAINGITAGNWLDTVGGTPATVDGAVGTVVNARGGANLVQATTGNKPILRSGLVNQATYSSDFSNATWQQYKASAVGSKIVANTENSYHDIQRNYTHTAGSIQTYAIEASTAEYENLRVADGSNAAFYASLNTRTGVSSSSGGPRLVSVSSTLLPSGRAVIAITVTGITPAWQLGFIGYPASGATLTGFGVTYTGDGTSGINVHAQALYQGTVTAQQIIDAGGIPVTTTAPASSAAGPFAWRFDGSNDSFTSTLTTGDNGFFCAGVAFDSGQDAYSALLYAGEVDVAKKSVYLFKGTNGFNARKVALAISDGTNRYILNSPYQVAVGVPVVVDCGWSSVQRFIAVNGSVTSESSANTYGPSAGAAQIGTYFGSNNLNGRLFPVFFAPTVLPTVTERATLRQFIASLSGVTL